MNFDAITWLATKLKCDADGCDHVETVAEISADLIGKPCPKCGSNLLTSEDHQKAAAMKSMLDLVNALVGPINVDESQKLDGVVVSVNPHGGQTTIIVNPEDA